MRFLIIFILTVNICYAQKTNQIQIYYGFVDSELLRNDELDGAASYDNKNSYEIGIKYLKNISRNFRIETGINFFKARVKITPSFTGVPVTSTFEKLRIVSIPIYANYSFGKFFFINGGPILDFQNSKKSFDSQSGIGYGIGVGGKYSFNNFVIYLYPNFKRHSSIPFKKENYHQKLTEFGMQIGIGYKL